jgi:ribosome-associated toxin RatA of RatAB toxin-antitoxin module
VSSTTSVSQRIVLAADPDTVMDVVADIEAYPEWQPDLKEVEVLATDGDGWVQRARFVVAGMGLSATFTLDYAYTDHEMRWRLHSSDVFSRNDGAYLLRDRGDGTTEVTYELAVDTTLSLPGFLRRQIATRVVDSALKGVKRRVET